uniref:Uncharacterized protein n=1 Tax=Anguilla anguilla TaxID=7936 RepID=A0A0E9X5H8_ANGAN
MKPAKPLTKTVLNSRGHLAAVMVFLSLAQRVAPLKQQYLAFTTRWCKGPTEQLQPLNILCLAFLQEEHKIYIYIQTYLNRFQAQVIDMETRWCQK